MINRKILSVSIAGYNVEKTLHETLAPFLKCKHLDMLDIIVIDDGSKDNTVAVANEFVSQRPDVFRVISKTNGGWGSTVNMGIDLANGKYFKQLDGDDHYNPENLDMMLELLQTVNADLVITPYISYDDRSGEQIDYSCCNPGLEEGTVYFLRDIEGFTPFMHAICLKTSLLKESKIRITEKCFYTDTEFVLKSINQVETVVFFNHVIYCYRRASAGQSMSLAGLEKHHMEQYTVIKTVLDYKKNYVTSDAVLKIYDRLLFGTCLWHYLVMMYIRPTLRHKIELIRYDRMIKKLAPEFYDRIDIGVIRKLRKTFFFGYFIAATYKKKKDNRFTKDGRMIY